MSNRPFARTRLTVSKSQELIRRLLIDNGARGVQFSENFEAGTVTVKFAKFGESGAARTVTFTLNIPSPKRERFDTAAAAKAQEQRRAATFAALHDVLKAQFAFVAYGGMSFEDMFLSHFQWVIDGRATTIGAIVKQYIDNPMQLLLSAPARDAADLAAAGASGEVVEGTYTES